METELWANEVSHCGNRDFQLFCSCDLDRMTFIFKHDLYCLEIYRMCKYKIPMSGLSKVIVWHTYIPTDRQTQPKLYTTPLDRWSIKLHFREA